MLWIHACPRALRRGLAPLLLAACPTLAPAQSPNGPAESHLGDTRGPGYMDQLPDADSWYADNVNQEKQAELIDALREVDPDAASALEARLQTDQLRIYFYREVNGTVAGSHDEDTIVLNASYSLWALVWILLHELDHVDHALPGYAGDARIVDHECYACEHAEMCRDAYLGAQGWICSILAAGPPFEALPPELAEWTDQAEFDRGRLLWWCNDLRRLRAIAEERIQKCLQLAVTPGPYAHCLPADLTLPGLCPQCPE